MDPCDVEPNDDVATHLRAMAVMIKGISLVLIQIIK